MELDDKACLCFHVSKRKIVNFIRIRQPRVPSQVSECGSAGTGCGWCVPFLKRLFEEFRHGREDPEVDRMTAAEYARQRGGYIRAGHGTPPPGATLIPDEVDRPDV